ncbi:MAG: metal-dependent hydrolase [Rubritalea sp.]|tara:strand:+ start:1389 stop:2501 length:1113 start_codon:yes stop_codon:yes gene_type:complete
MDSITQAALGALCGELVLGKKLGNKGILWGLLFGTLPDLDIIAYPFLTASEQLGWHRGISHSIFMMFVAAALFGWLLHKIHQKKDAEISYARAAWFVFLAWSTHVLIDCFNTYGTMILEPFSSKRISINNLFIIDLFFLVPILICLILAMVWGRKNPARRMKITTITSCWLCIYFLASLVIKQIANNHFEQLLTEKGIVKERMMTAPTFSNIFLWRMVAEDHDGETIHTSYWSLLDSKDQQPAILSFKKDHQLEVSFQDSADLKALTSFTGGLHKTYQDPRQPNTIYIAALNMGEMHINTADGNELRPAFIWKITRNDDETFSLDRAFKMSKDGSKYLKKAVANTVNRALGNTDHWMKGDIKWTWDLIEQ